MSLYVEVGTERCTKCELNDVLFQPIISVLIVATFFSFITYSLFLCYLLLAGGERGLILSVDTLPFLF